MPYQLREADKKDYHALQRFINSQNYLHRHLDWRDTLDWLGAQPFYVIEESHRLLAAFACPPEPAEIAWVRLFGVSANLSPDRAWKAMFDQAREVLASFNPRPVVVSLALRDWYEALLQRSGFQFHQDIVVFLYDGQPPPARPLDDAITLREMKPQDLAEVEQLDNLAFEPVWRLSKDDLMHAYHKSAYSTVAELDGKIIAYQMSSTSGFYAHLARLAVDPGLQRRHIGYAVVQDLLDYFIEKKACWGVTLNTQHDNLASLALYHRLGFRETGEKFPLYNFRD